MEWTADVSAGDWVRTRLDDSYVTIHGVVPRGFAAYARVFHPAERDRPVGVLWPPHPPESNRREWEAFSRAGHTIDTQQVSWRDTAAAFDTVFHPLAQWHRVVRQRDERGVQETRDAAGWRYFSPHLGRLTPSTLAAVAVVLASHTTTPDDGFVALWEGWGGTVGYVGYGPSRVLLQEAGSTSGAQAHTEFLAHATRDIFNDVFRRPSWQPGILSDQISQGPRLSLPDRDHVLFRGGVSEFAQSDWPRRAPWAEPDVRTGGYAGHTESPSLIWPADRAWILVSEIDFDSTIIGGSAALIADLCEHPSIEALQLPPDADLTETGDRLN